VHTEFLQKCCFAKFVIPKSISLTGLNLLLCQFCEWCVQSANNLPSWWLMAGAGLFWEKSTAGWLRLVAGGWFVLREKYCWLVADKPSEQAWPVRLVGG
jgi:hypothetical protein